MEEIIPGLWIGDLACALATDYLSLAGITHIVTAMKQSLPSPVKLPDGRRIEKAQMYHVNIDDVENAPILVHLPGAVEFINEALDQQWIEEDDEEREVQEGDNKVNDKEEDDDKQEGSSTSASAAKVKGQWATMGEGTVLVHCQAGISRSVAIVAAYLMRTRSISVTEAIELIQSRRSQADPNPGFRMQLELYQSSQCNVDVRNQRIRRFLMSQSSILKGDPIDDIMLSYYPSPFHSPANSSSSSLNNGMGNLQLSTLDGNTSTETSSDGIQTRLSRSSSSAGLGVGGGSGTESGRTSASMSRQGSRAAAAAAAASQGAQRQKDSDDNTHPDGTPHTLLDLSKSPPMPENASELFDEVDQSQLSDEDPSRALIKEQFTSVKDDHEVMITIGKGKLPGGVDRVTGNQGRTNGDTRLPKPHFRGLKLRCRLCRRDLAARDHIVEHEAGRGKDAFDVRKREKDSEAKSRDARTARDLGIEQRFGAQTRRQATPPPLDDEDGNGAAGEGGGAAEVDPQVQATTAQNGTMKSAANLSAQLPPHLAALRQGRAGQATSTPDRSVKSVLHSPQCSAYYVEPLAWMSAIKQGEVAGRLECPNARCGAKLGSWDWAGMQCACGAWVTPAFALHRSKVDEVL